MQPGPCHVVQSATLSRAGTRAGGTASRTPTYPEILKSSALIGGSSVVTLVVGILRTKSLALLLGPSGFGLMGIFSSIADLSRSIAEMGINSSGVRQIADATASSDTARIARTVAVLRRVAIVLGMLGAIVLAIAAKPIAELTFGNDEHAGAIVLLSLAVLFRVVAEAQGALVQGMRRIGDLARINVIGAVFGAVVSIPFVYFLREHGVVPSLVAIAAMSIATSWWYSRKVDVGRPAVAWRDVRHEIRGLLKLGFAFMASGLLMTVAAYAVRIIVLRHVGLGGAGLYQAAWSIGGLYVAFVLQAMGADFYPRLVGAARNDAECNRLVNEQALVSLLLAGPGVLATLTFAPLAMHLLYSAQFTSGVDLLRWVCLGMALRVITWPMGYIIIARGETLLFLFTELAWTLVNVGLSWLCVQSLGLNGAGMAFFGSYVFHAAIIYPIVRGLTGFSVSRANVSIALLFVGSIALVFGGFYTLPPAVATGMGAAVTLLSAIYSIRVLVKLVSPDRIPRRILRLLAMFGLARSASASLPRA
jgi:PST family polysaccharide transporter